MTNEQIKEIVARAEDEHEYLKDRVHDLYDENVKLKGEIERLNNKEEQLIRGLEDLIIVGEQVENEWAVDICKMIIKELKGSDKE